MRALRRHGILGFKYSHVLLISLTSNKSLIGAVSNDTGLYVFVRTMATQVQVNAEYCSNKQVAIHYCSECRTLMNRALRNKR